ncbi:MAG: hypothetical protein LBK08_06000 [Treponema sp.]|jgi:hypothetical protein|nr:hypothetical protein [Treponema sp.]
MFENCREFEDTRENIVCEEKRTKVTFHNSARETVAKIRIDGCVITDKAVKKCDYLLLCVGIRKAVFVELKGNKVIVAIEQLSATLDNEIIKEPLKQYKKRAYAVVTGNPFPLSKIQNIQDGFSKKHRSCTLRVVRSSRIYDLMSGKPIT